MSQDAYRSTGKKSTPQTQPIPGREAEMGLNAAGGFAFNLEDWPQFRRFLILGTAGGTYYADEFKLTADNTQVVARCIQQDGQRAVDEIVKVSDEGLAPKNDPALLALAMACADSDINTRRIAFAALPKVARTGTHLLHFASYVDGLRGWGSGMRRAVGRWFTDKTPEQLAYQLVKYRQRDQWATADLLRLAHVKPPTEVYDKIFKWVVDGWTDDNYLDYTASSEPWIDQAKLIWAAETAQRATINGTIIDMIEKYGIPWETIPTEFLRDGNVWDALLHNSLPLHATLRNLGRMTNIGLIENGSDAEKLVVSRLTDQAYIHKSRLHPMAILVALKTYAQGKGMRGDLTWNPTVGVNLALEQAFELAFHNIEPAQKRFLLGLDVSGSMTGPLGKIPLQVREATAAMAVFVARKEPACSVMAFAHRFINLPIDANTSYKRACDLAYRSDFGGTNCALPMQYAMQTNLPVDVFVIMTDNETWAGQQGHPAQVLEQYRQKSGIPAKLIVMAMTSTGFSICDPKDPNSLDVAGFATDTPQVVGNFAAGRI